MHNIEMQEMNPDFLACWQAAGMHLNHQVEGGIQSWLRAHPYPPVLEHLSFRLGNQLFFVRIEDASGNVEGPGSKQGLLSIAEGCQGHACLMPMKKKFFGDTWVPAEPGWGLINADTGEPVNPIALVTDEKIEVTRWELHDFAVQVVRHHLEKDGYQLMSWQGNPDVDPAIWFVGESKNLNGSLFEQLDTLSWQYLDHQTGNQSLEIAHGLARLDILRVFLSLVMSVPSRLTKKRLHQSIAAMELV